MSYVTDSTGILKKNDYRITGPRMAVLEVLAKAEEPLSAYDIEERIPGNIPINVVTIYRVLEVFEKLGIAHRIHTKEGYMRCRFEAEKGCHYFAVCSQCGRAYEFINNTCSVKGLIPKNLPFKELKHLSEVSGTCDHCLTSKK